MSHLQGLQSFRVNLFQCSLPTGCSSFIILTCCSVENSMGSRGRSVPAWSFQGLQVNLGFNIWITSSLSFSSPVGAGRIVSHTFPPHSSLWVSSVLPSLTQAFPKMPPSWLQGSDVPCGGSVGPGWNQLCPVWGRPGLSTQRLPCSPLPAIGHLSQ